MTALSGMVQPGGAYLLTDGAGLDAAGIVTEIGSKVLDLDAQRMAIGWSGYLMIGDLEAAVAAAPQSQDEVFKALPAIMRGIAASNVLVGKRDNRPTPPIRLLVAMWNVEAQEPRLWAIHSDTTLFGPRYTPFTPVRIRHCTALEPETQADVFGRLPDYGDPADFDVRRDGMTMLEAERMRPYDDGRYCVGGLAQLTSVTANGVTVEVLGQWPDVVGRPINPFV